MGPYTSIYQTIAISMVLLSGCQQPNNTEEGMMQRVAERMEANGNHRDAVQIYKEILNKTDRKLPIYMKISDSYVQAGDIKGAKAVLQEALVMDEKNQIKSRLAKCHLLEGSHDKALPLYQQIVQMEPDDAQIHNGIGLTYTLQGADGPAIASYQKAVQLEPQNLEYQSNLGLALALKGDYQKALEFLVPLGTRPQATPKQRHNLAFVYGLSGDERQAQTLFEQDLTPTDIEQNLNTIRVLRQNHPKGQISPRAHNIHEVRS